MISKLEKIYSILDQETKNFNVPVIDLIKLHTNDPYKVLIATILSARTKDEVTKKAAERLFVNAKNFKELSEIKEKEIEKLIFPVGFYKTKAKHLRQVGALMVGKYGGKMPMTLPGLLELPGVGRKTANLVLAVAFNEDAICVDTHVQRIFNRLGLIKTKTPFETEKALQKLLPKKYWKKTNQYFVALGQNVCKPISPKCNICKIARYCEKIIKS